MKLITITLLSMLLFFSCSEPIDSLSKGTFGFNITQKENISSGRQNSKDNPSKLIFSLKDENGQYIFNHDSMSLVSIGDNYITKSFELPVGEYYLTEFILVSEQGEALFITPIVGSEKAKYSYTPLPILVAVMPDSYSTVPVEALEVEEDDDPSDFGLTEFSITLTQQISLDLIVANNGTPIDDLVELTGFSNGFELYNYQLEVPNTGKSLSLFDNIDSVEFASIQTSANRVIPTNELKEMSQIVLDIAD